MWAFLKHEGMIRFSIYTIKLGRWHNFANSSPLALPQWMFCLVLPVALCIASFLTVPGFGRNMLHGSHRKVVRARSSSCPERGHRRNSSWARWPGQLLYQVSLCSIIGVSMVVLQCLAGSIPCQPWVVAGIESGGGMTFAVKLEILT